MKNATQPFAKITIPSPCREDWTGMELNDKGRFCGKCAKSVVDFSRFTEQQLQDYLEKNRHSPICGRIPISKLNKPLYLRPVKQRYSGWWIWAALTGSSLSLQAQVESEMVQFAEQNKDIELFDSVINDTSFIHVKGFIADQKSQERLPFATIKAFHNTIQCFTDLNGEFDLKIPADLKPNESIDVTITYVGYQTKRLDFVYSELIAKQNSTIQLELDMLEISMVGMVIYQRPSWHKRVWYRVKRIFKLKRHEIE